ncbi:MAG: hypothetical protein ABI852_21125, partial [Gemmatimonadaceae bacterium]
GCDFKSIDDLALLPDGGIVAISQSTNLMRHFDAAGKLIGDVGRFGSGPGEFQSLISAQYRNNQMIWFDVRQMRTASVGLDGKPGPVVRLVPPQTMQMMYLAGYSLIVFDVPAATTQSDTVVGQYRTVPVSGSPRILASIRTPALFRPGSNQRPVSGPFAPKIVADVGVNETVAHSNGAKYTVDVVPTNGTPWHLESEAPTRNVVQADRDSVVARALKTYKAANVASLPPLLRAQFESMPKTFPPLLNIRVLRDGTVWIKPTPDRGATDARWDVFTFNGKRIGAARLPVTALVRDGAKDWVLVVELNKDDVPTVVKYRVTPN